MGFGLELLKVVYTQFILHLNNTVTIIYEREKNNTVLFSILQLNSRLALEKIFLLVDDSLQSF